MPKWSQYILYTPNPQLWRLRRVTMSEKNTANVWRGDQLPGTIYRQILSPTKSLNKSNLAKFGIEQNLDIATTRLSMEPVFWCLACACMACCCWNFQRYLGRVETPWQETLNVSLWLDHREEYEDNLQQMPTKQTFSAKTLQIGAFEIGTFQMPPTTVKCQFIKSNIYIGDFR